MPDLAHPTGLKPVIDVIPEKCYRRSTWRGMGLLTRDLAIYGLAVWGLVSTDNVLLLVPLWLVAGAATAALFVVGHDAAHEALFDSRRLNAIVACIAMLPSLHATEGWVFGHNRVHHGHTLKQGVDFVWHPLTVEQFEELTPFQRRRHRFEWGPIGSGQYYFREIWWNKMMRFSFPTRWASRVRRDKVIIGSFALAVAIAAILVAGPVSGLWLWVKIVVVPFLVFCHFIGWVVYVHHIAPDIRWWPRREWNRFRGQVEGTTVLWGPPLFDPIFHWIMVHLPHHVDMRIPCYRLADAARAIAAAFPDYVDQRRLRMRDFLSSVRECKLYDFDEGFWLRYP
jgi:omega-6 fatty acid desaturase (delta-12 desaturase)